MYARSPPSSRRTKGERPMAPLALSAPDQSTSTSRRRRMAFMKYGSEQRRSSISMHRSREHAKQIAMSIGDVSDLPTPSSSASFADFGSAFAGEASKAKPVDDLFGGKDPFAVSNIKQTTSLFDEDPFSSAALQQENAIRAASVVSSVISSQKDDFAVDKLPWPKQTQTMATMPANSSMQSAFVQSHTTTASTPDRRTAAPAVATTPPAPHSPYNNSTTSASGAAARRRMRNQMRKASGAAEQQTPPKSPYSVKRYQSSDSVGSAASRKDHVQNYTTTTNRSVASSSARSVGSSAAKSITSSDSSELNLFDKKHPSGGFTFDAFGLDASQITREVSEAMNDIYMANPDLSFFLNQDPTDDFAAGRWEDSPAPSRSSTPVIPESSDGFVDGFRVTMQMPVHVRQSPTSTERSSLTSESSERHEHGRVNLFKEQAGFSSSTTGRKLVRPSERKAVNGFVRAGPRMPDLEETAVPLTRPTRLRPEDVEFFDPDFSDHTDSDNNAAEPSETGARSDVGVSSDVLGGSDFENIPAEIRRHKQKAEAAAAAKTAQEEKKEDEEELQKPDVGSLKAKWEKQTPIKPLKLSVVTKSPTRTQGLGFSSVHSHGSPQHHSPSFASIRERLDSPRRQSEQHSPSFASLRDHLGSPRTEKPGMSSARSEGGATFKSAHVNSILGRIERESPRDTHSDTGAPSPAFAAVKLRRTGFSPKESSPQNEFSEPPVPETKSSETEITDMPVDEKEAYREIKEQRRGPNLTYRERRELEMQQQREEEERRNSSQKAEEVSHHDVRAQIKRRIAANKNAQDDRRDSDMEQVSNHSSRQRDLIIQKSPPRRSPRENDALAHPSSAIARLIEQQAKGISMNSDRTPFSPPKEKKAPAIQTVLSSDSTDSHRIGKSHTPKATMMMLNAFLAGRESISSHEAGSHDQEQPGHVIEYGESAESEEKPYGGPRLPALQDDPEYERYFKMLKLGMPMEVVKHAMTRDGKDPSVMDGDPNKPVGIPLKHDPEYEKYFRMLKIGLPMEAVKHAMERDGLDSSVMDQDHDLPVQKQKSKDDGEPKEKDSHRRARLHWKPLRKVTSNSLWAQIDQDDALENIEIDEDEFQELFQLDKSADVAAKPPTQVSNPKRGAVRVIDPKRANNGGIILARLKMSHDDMADAVDRINEQALTAEQIENIIEYLPTKDERKALESYMLEGGQDAAEKFEALCECEKFMVSMMTVKHAKRKVRALLFKLQFQTCLEDIYNDTITVEAACDELINSVRLRQLLGIILEFGNRLNTAGNGQRRAGAFTLDSLLKLNQAKAFDKKTTFLNYIVLIVRRNNELLLRFKDDLPTVFKADKVYWDQCVSDLEEVENQLENVRKISLYQARQSVAFRQRKKKRDDDEESLSDGEISLTLEEEVEALRATPIGMFTLSAIKYVSSLRDKVEDTKEKYDKLKEYFGVDEGSMQPHEIFSIIVAFSRDFEKAKEIVFANEKKKLREERKRQAKDKAQTGRPPTHSPAPNQMLRASNFQPSMSSVLKEIKSRSPIPESMESPVTPDRRVVSQERGSEYSPSQESSPLSSRTTQNHVSNKHSQQSHYRESHREAPSLYTPPTSKQTRQPETSYPTPPLNGKVFEDQNDSFDDPSKPALASRPTTSSTRAALREKARMRRNRFSGSASPPPPVATKSNGMYGHSVSSDDGAAKPLDPRSSMRARMAKAGVL